MTPHSSHFENYKSITSSVRIGDDSTLSVDGVGDIVFGDASLHDVVHVPRMSKNLFSVSKATSKGLGVYFDDDVVEVIDRSSLSIVAHGSQQGGLYHITSFSSHQSLHNSHLHQLFDYFQGKLMIYGIQDLGMSHLLLCSNYFLSLWLQAYPSLTSLKIMFAPLVRWANYIELPFHWRLHTELAASWS